jgi:hypothetical protein
LCALLHCGGNFPHSISAGWQTHNPFNRNHPVEQCKHCGYERKHQTFIHRFISSNDNK